MKQTNQGKGIGMRQAIFMSLLSAALSALAACANSHESRPKDNLPIVDLSSGITTDALRMDVGKRIHLEGIWHPNGEYGPYLMGPLNARGPMVFLRAITQQGQSRLAAWEQTSDGTPARATGVLQAEEAEESETGEPTRHETLFYMNATASELRFIRAY